MEAKEFILDGKKYITQPELSGCNGCIAHYYAELCNNLPSGCSDGEFIYIGVEDTELPNTEQPIYTESEVLGLLQRAYFSDRNIVEWFEEHKKK